MCPRGKKSHSLDIKIQGTIISSILYLSFVTQAQKQIFNLMKFDSYSRFLKSGLYKDCVNRDMRGQTLPYPGDHTLDPDLRIHLDDSHIKVSQMMW